MRKILLALTFGISSVALAQPNVSVTLNTPAANDNISDGTQFTMDFTIANNGTVAIAATDSIIYAPVVNGSFLAGQGGGPLLYLNQQAIPVGGSVTISRPFGLTGGSTGTLSFCAFVDVWGPLWNGVVESDTTDNLSCNTVNYTTGGGTVSTAEFTVISPSDDSYYANGTYFVRMSNQSFVSTPSLVVYNITGVEVFRTELSGNGSDIDQNVALNGLSKGIYIVTIKDDANILSSKKIAVQ